MRPIKFRAWNIKKKIMVYNVETVYDGHTHVDGDYEDIHDKLSSTQYFGDILTDENLIVMQFTGLLDRNGKEIYEGDILKNSKRSIDWKNPSVIEFEMENNCGECSWVWGWNFPDDKEEIEKEYEIIGNIYANPELYERK